ncbi:CPA2 family monovalent cation:H+ antiporter-2/glutathione-regulated potassium-efflux system protein KefB [Methylorubrum rhodinum]|uniref:CPA2 family monovalent cation:H+ antiporter-2/glutathione-regulated potassium-efflux system protein KefB n=1 Tax=Methylorubrum rhodinum TaxID=29428 RepID=A0A840ZHT2_9HYPH|nr:monovalent cation:proton antiporter-2 (CPA2) family protein [Methylorubrum rhodinum]MBB5757582.1 CPA2 family monovalent cation:H+ antiporter-2/glutathione-regulated potassium-efflux system protein KefB [Methylorubrum rhodinum]
MAAEASGAASELVQVVSLLAAGVIAVPLFKRLGLGSVLGYLLAGLVIGPFGLGLFTDAHAILHVAELGVVMFLFVIGLEMEPSRLWGMRRAIFGLGLTQVAACIGALTLVGVAMGLSVTVAFVAGTGFVLTSTAIVMQLLEERGAIASPKGQRIVAILLLEDLAIVPLLAAVALLAPGGPETSGTERAVSIALALASVAALVAAGRWLLNPLFRLLAASKAREVMTAAALLVVLGSALAMQLGGLSMAMGAFLAGVLLSESSFRHQLEADIEPFRGILLGLFFLGVGMSVDLAVIGANGAFILLGVAAYMAVKGLVIYAVARALRAAHAEALERAVLMAQGGEFAFVLYAAAASAGIIDAVTNAILTATVILSMALTPLMVIALDRFGPKATASTDGVEAPEDLVGSALIVGFGRFGQIASQPLISRGCSVSIIDTDPANIRLAEGFGFKVYYGDGTRLDILRAAGAENARAILICVDAPETARRIAEIAKAEFPLVPVLARARDRAHAIALIQAGVAYQVRETVESAFALGERALLSVGADPDAAVAMMEDVRRRDAERLELEIVGGIYAGRELIRGNATESAHGGH